jgi:hypothetical protein
MVVVSDEGRTVLTSCERIGRGYGSMRRNNGTSAANAVRIVAGAPGGGSMVALRMDVMRSWVVTW